MNLGGMAIISSSFCPECSMSLISLRYKTALALFNAKANQ